MTTRERPTGNLASLLCALSFATSLGLSERMEHGLNSAYIGLYYAPSNSLSITSPYGFEAPGVGGVIANTVAFTGTMPSVTFSSTYAPVPPASRLTG